MSSPNSPVEANADIGVNTDPASVAPAEQKRGAVYWLFKNTFGKTWESAKANKKTYFVLGLAALWFAFVFRAYWQPAVISARIHTAEIISLSGLAALMYWSMRKPRHWKAFFGTLAFTAAMVAGHLYLELPPLRYLTLYARYQALDPVVLSELPVTAHERIQPQASVRVLGGEAMNEVERVSDPDFVRIGDEFRWTMAIEPANPGPRSIGKVEHVLSVSGSAASPNFSGENRIPVSFRVAEEMYMGKSTDVAVTRSFGLFRFFSFSPRDVKYVKDDKGEWVEVVSLVRWRGIFFVWPEFGGVQIIRQKYLGPKTRSFWKTVWYFIRYDAPLGVRSWFLGDGEWIKPEDVYKHKFLAQQNTVPYEVSRYAALSLRFQNSFWSPIPWYHKGDIRIPDLEGDDNDQPFTTYFKFSNGLEASPEDKLYHYFALEPYGYYDKKQGLNTSVFVPADGVGKVRIYRHYTVNEALTGVSAIAPKVMESQKSYDWEQSRPVEHRPWVKDIDGKRRFFWFTTVVTYKDKKEAGNPKFMAGSTPAVTLTDALYKNVVWVNPNESSKWTVDVKERLAPVWATKQ